MRDTSNSYLFVLGKKSAELPFVSSVDRLSIMAASTKSFPEWKRGPATSLTVPHTGMAERRPCFHQMRRLNGHSVWVSLLVVHPFLR